MQQKKYILTVKTSDGKDKDVEWDQERDPTQSEADSLPEYKEPAKETKPGVLKSTWNKLNEPLIDLGSRAGKALGEPLIDWGEKHSADDSLISKVGSKAARYGGAFSETFGEGLDTLSSPLSLALTVITGGLGTAAKGLGRGTQAVSDAEKALFAAKMAGNTSEAARLAPELNAARLSMGRNAATAGVLSKVSRAAGATQAGVAAEEGIRKKDIKQIIPFALGMLGTRGGKLSEIPPSIDIPELPTSFEGLTSREPNSPRISWNDPQQQGLGLEFEPTEIQRGLITDPRSANIEGAPSPQIDLFESLVPNRYKSTGEMHPTDLSNVTGPKQPELFDVMKANESVVQRPMIPSNLEPRLAGLGRPTWSRFAEQRELPFDYDTLTQAETSGVPEIVKAVEQVAQKEALKPKDVTFSRSKGYQATTKPQSNIGKVKDNVIKSNDTVLRQDSPAGNAIMDMITKFRTETGHLSGSISAAIKDVVEPLNKPQYDEFQSLLDQGGTSRDPMINNALDVAREIDGAFTKRAMESGLHLKTSTGELVPFTGKDNYWPRMYDPSFFADKPALIARLIKGGMSTDAANNAVNNAKKFGERLIDPQNSRVLDLPEHRKDLGALLKHYDDMAHRVVAAEEFGVKDIADPESPISNLVKDTKDPKRVGQILRQYLDRENSIDPHDADVAKKIHKVATAYYLSKFAIANTNQIGMVPIVTNFSSTAKAVGQFIKNPKATWREAEATGALQTVMQEAMREVGGESGISKAYGIKASEGSNRTISAIAGKHYAIDLFNKAKKGNVAAQRSIADLTLEPWDNLASQDTLTDKNIAYAATRVAEKTQGRAQSIDLPYGWSKSPYIGLLTLYKKYAFVQNKLMKEALKADPSKPIFSKQGVNINPRNAALMLGLFQLTGEATGDIKAMISGAMTGNPGEKVENRGEYWNTGNSLINRVIQNYSDSMFLGLLGDAAQSVRGGHWGMANAAMGPIFSAPIEIGGNVISDFTAGSSSTPLSKRIASNAVKLKNHPSKSKTLQGLASHIPYAGSAVRNWMKEP